jgi:hypothetical protein
MKEIMVIFVEALDVNLPAGQPPDASAGETDDANESIVDNHSAPPFWTWFIENPRPRSFTSVGGLAGLTLATRSA